MNKIALAAALLLMPVVAGAQFKNGLPPAPTSGSGPMKVQVPQASNSGVVQLTPGAAVTPPLESARRISQAEAQKLVKQGKAVYVDVRSKTTYDQGHIKGAISMPGSQMQARFNELPVGKTLITYCACVEEHTAAVAVLNLNAHGIKNTAALIGGWNSWKAAGLPIEVTR